MSRQLDPVCEKLSHVFNWIDWLKERIREKKLPIDHTAVLMIQLEAIIAMHSNTIPDFRAKIIGRFKLGDGFMRGSLEPKPDETQELLGGGPPTLGQTAKNVLIDTPVPFGKQRQKPVGCLT